MKIRSLLTFAALLVLSTVSAQYNVSTEVSKKNILIEEYTGIHCGYCPQAHKIVSELMKVQGDKVYAIAIHAGSYSVPNPDQPDFRVSNGAELNEHFDVTSYPSGMVNRQRFSEEYPTPLCNRTLWAAYAHLENLMDAPVNLWMSSSYDETTRKLTVNVEGYFTADIDGEESFLTVVVTENNIMGPQSGSGMGDEYIHQHMARAWLTPTLGETLTNCKKGEFFSRQYIYDVPEALKEVAVNPAELEVVAFVCQNDENVLNVIGCQPECPDYEAPLAAEIADALIPVGNVYGYNFFDVQLTNKSTEDITSATFTITFNSVDYEVEWTGVAPARTTSTIRLPFDMTDLINETANKYTIKLTGLNGPDYKGNKFNGKFNAPYKATPTIELEIVTDIFADENRFLIKDTDGNVVTEVGPYELGKVITTSQIIELLPNTTYCFEITDSWSNGIMEGGFKLYDANKNIICEEDYIENHGYHVFFTTGDYNVSTELQNKNVLIEEFTGIHCGNCPDAHELIDEILKAQGEVVYALAYHSGYYAVPFPEEPEFRTEYGDSLDIYFIPDGYPSGMVNRNRYDNQLMLARNLWSTTAHDIVKETAPVNLWICSQYDSDTRVLTVYVEGYYTQDVEADENMLNVHVSQSGILGPQNGSSMGDNYVHKHMFRANLTPMWGDTITGCKTGDMFKKQYTYVVPDDINGVATDPINFEVVAFLCNDKEEVLNVVGGKPSCPGIEVPMNAKLELPLIPISGTYGYNYYEALLVNNSTEDIIEAGFDITLNGELYLTEWVGLAPARSTTLIKIPFNQVDLIKSVNDFEIKLGGVNYKLYDGNSFSGDFQDPYSTTPTNKFVIKTDNYADDNHYVIKDMSGNVVHEFGPFPVGVVTEFTEELKLNEDNVYCLEITDAWGNGIMSPRGTCKIYNANGKLVAQQLEIKNHGCRIFFATTVKTAVGTIDAASINVHYNAAHRNIEVNVGGEQAHVAVYNAAGQCVYEAETAQSLNIPVAANGVYIVKVATQEQQKVTKIAAN